jgi:CDP-glucose 4,6-dehydratase
MESVEGMIGSFYKNKRVFVTGHTGFKGSWLCAFLSVLGAEVSGYALKPPTDPALYDIAGIDKSIQSVIGDIRDLELLKKSLKNFGPQIVIHMAAQPIVRASYADPVYTYETNVLGTVNILEAIRNCDTVKSFLNVTTDKVYENKEWDWGYREIDRLCGWDPYSNSKSCSELVTHSYKNSFFSGSPKAVSTVRAGNVIGGGDFAQDRIIPDCVRAVLAGQEIAVRNPYSVRPYQHVLEPLFAYLTIAEKQFENKDFQGSYNIGPNESDCVTTGQLADLFCEEWGNIKWKNKSSPDAVHEANFLKLDCSLAKNKFGISPKWNIKTAVKKTVEWTKCFVEGQDPGLCMQKQISGYLKGL